MIEEFFNPDDGLTVTGRFVPSGREIQGYFDITETDLLEDQDDIETAQFVCPRKPWLAAEQGQILELPLGKYRINKVKPDGTGLALLTLLKGE
mgnify:CR=1 FL=1